MVLREGDIVRVDYTGVDEKGEVFDTTLEKKAIEAGIYNEKRQYKPLIAVIGEKNFFEKIDEKIRNAEEGKKFSVELEPKEAFGERNTEFIRMVPMRDFKARKLTPYPGMPVEINNLQGRVQTVSGGRVRVDFNHPLAGKKLKYEIEIKETITGREEKINALIEKFFSLVPIEKIKHELKSNTLEITLPPETANMTPIKKALAETTLKYIEGIQRVRFVEEYTKTEKKEDTQGKNREEKTQLKEEDRVQTKEKKEKTARATEKQTIKGK